LKVLAVLFVAAMIVACSNDAPASAQSQGKAPTPAAPECIDEFAQEYEEVAEDPPRETPPNVCFSEQSPAEGPPKFPAMSRKVRLEYKHGDYFVTQDSASWSFGDADTARRCIVAKLVKVRIVAISEGGKSQSVKIEDGQTLRSSDTGDQYRSSIHLGSTFSDKDVVPGYRMSLESTPFGHDCMRATPEGATHISTCSFVQPHTCRSVRYMLPAEMRIPSNSNGVQVGRTTRLDVGAVDPSTWVLP